MTVLGAMQISRAQRNLGRLGLYLGRVDGLPGPLTCDALVNLLAGPHAPQLVGGPLAAAIPRNWWAIPNRVNMLFANVFAECGFVPLQEDLDYTAERLVAVWPSRFSPGRGSDPKAFEHNPIALANLVYGGRDGNNGPTDGWHFRGRGWPQLTGRANYRAFSDAAGVNLEAEPHAMMRLDVCARVTVAFMTRTLGLLAAADAADTARVRHLWNGGAVGLDDTQDAFDKLTSIWETLP